MKTTKRIIAILFSLIIFASGVVLLNIRATNREVLKSWDFENANQRNEWTMADKDGDSHLWSYGTNSDTGFNPRSGQYIMYSYSYYSGSLTPDNYAVSCPVALTGNYPAYCITWFSYEYSPENLEISIYEETSPSNQSNINSIISQAEVINEIITSDDASSDYYRNQVDISRFAGKTIRIVFRHCTQNGQNAIILDDISVEGYYSPREYLYSSSFETADEQSGWTFIDKDGDGSLFTIWSNKANSGSKCIRSYSYNNKVAYTPDNYAISPVIPVPSYNSRVQMDCFIGASSPEFYGEKFSIYVYTGGKTLTSNNIESELAGQKVLGPQTLTIASYKEFSIDLDNVKYKGSNIQLVFRHHDCTDQSALLIDDVSVSMVDLRTELSGATAAVASVELGKTPQAPSVTAKDINNNNVTIPAGNLSYEWYKEADGVRTKVDNSAPFEPNYNYSVDVTCTLSENDYKLADGFAVAGADICTYSNSQFAFTINAGKIDLIHADSISVDAGFYSAGGSMTAPVITVSDEQDKVLESGSDYTVSGQWSARTAGTSGAFEEITETEFEYRKEYKYSFTVSLKAPYQWAAAVEAFAGTGNITGENGEYEVTFTPFELTAISSLEVTGAENPVAFSSPGTVTAAVKAGNQEISAEDVTITAGYAVKENGDYQFTSEPFDADKEYAVKVEGALSANSQYTFAGLEAEGFAVEVENNGLNFTAIKEFESVGLNPIDEVQITVTPADGEPEVTVEPSEKYTFEVVKEEVTPGDPGNGAGEGGEPQEPGQAESTVYNVKVTLTPESGYEFTETSVFYVNGQIVEADNSDSGTGRVVETSVETADKYKTITWSYDNGSDDILTYVKAGEAIDEPDVAAEKIGYTFTGWLDGDEKAPADYTDGMPEEDLTFTAQWSINSYTLTFAPDNGEVNTVYDKDDGNGIAFGASFADKVPANPSKTGFTFTGWLDGDNKAPADYTDGMPAKDLTFTAQWQRNNYTITYVLGNGQADIVDTFAFEASTEGAPPADPTWTGHTFKGWDAATPSTMPAQNLTINATWDVNKYDLTLVFGNGDEPSVTKVTYGETLESAPSDPVRTGYTFADWLCSKDNQVYTSAQIGAYVMPAEDVTFTAQWNAIDYKVTYVLNNGEANIEQTYHYQDTVTAPADPSRTGYTFTGWDNVPATMPADNVTVTAQWEVIDYTIKFVLGNGKPDIVDTYHYQDTVTAPSDPTWTGHEFKGWSRNIPATMPAESIVITANWDVETYTVTYILNNGEENIVQSWAYESAITAPKPARKGYTFTGWEPAVPAKMPAEDVTVTAQWSLNKYTITYNTDGGSKVEAASFDYGAAVTAPADPSKPGYTFAGWKNLPERMPANNVEAKAIWTANEYEIVFDSNGGSAVEPIKAAYLSKVSKPANPERECYRFEGWYTDKALTKAVKWPAEMPLDGAKYYAKWSYSTSADIRNFTRSRSESYRTTITFHAVCKDIPEGAEIQWFKDGKKAGTGDKYTVEKAENRYTVQVKVVDGGKVCAESGVETVEISNGFFAKIIAFIRSLFGGYPVKDQ